MIATPDHPAATQPEVETDRTRSHAHPSGQNAGHGGRPPGGDPELSPREYEELAAQLNEEAQRLFSQGQYDASEDSVRRLLGLLERVVGKEHPDFAMGLSMLGELRFLQDDLAGAESLFRQGLMIRGATLGTTHPDYAVSLACLGGVLWRQGLMDEAETRFRQAMVVRDHALGARHPESVQSRKELARLLRRRGDWAGAQVVIAEGTTGALDLVGDSLACPDLLRRAVALFELLRSLGTELGPTARLMEDEGVPPRSTCLQKLDLARQAFARLRDETLLRIDALQVPAPAIETIGTLQDLAALLDDLADLELRHREREVMRLRSLVVLDRILSLAYAKDEPFPPLLECQERVRPLRTTIAGSHWLQLPAQTERLAEGTHVLVLLLRLVEELDRLSDRSWADLHEAVSESLGQPLASAASRRRLFLKEAPPGAAVTARPLPAAAAPRSAAAGVDPSSIGALSQPGEARQAVAGSDGVLIRELAVASLVPTMGRIINLPTEEPTETIPHRLLRVGHAPGVVERSEQEAAAAAQAAEEAASPAKPARVVLPPNIAGRLRIGLPTVAGLASGQRPLLDSFGHWDDLLEADHGTEGSPSAASGRSALGIAKLALRLGLPQSGGIDPRE